MSHSQFRRINAYT